MNKQFAFLLTIMLFASACTTHKFHYQKSDQNWDQTPVPNSELIYSLYMVGDAGGDTIYSTPVMNSLKRRLMTENTASTGVIFLGDNIYPEGLHKKSSNYRAQDESRINVQLDAVQDFQGDIFFIPGNHDWDKQGKGGWKHLKRQEEYIQESLDRGNVFLPSHGCPGPKDVKLALGLVMIIVDTQWWVHQFERPSGEKDGCDVRTPDELMVLFKDLLKKYRDQNVIVATHHPLYSNGHHGGHFQVKDHLFPLTAKNKNAYVPLPVIGSIYPFYRRFLGHPQDITHPVYQNMKNQLEKAMNEYENVIYVAGHEHNLQYVQEENIHHIVSGAGSKLTYLKFDKNIDFGARERGYSKVNYYSNGEVWLEFYTVGEGNGQDQLSYRKMLFQRDVATNEITAEIIKKSYEGQFATV
ncbi:MAG: metallophosphoesterase, partial [Flavobacteriales bacterium]|nr:metallophosphoesterase [Flavobacteriales bacterium]